MTTTSRRRPPWSGAPTAAATAVAVAAFGVMAAAQAVIPFVDQREVPTTIVVVAFFATTCALAATVWPVARVAAAAAVVVGATFVLELVGSTTGWPFGAYHYTEALRPQAAGVPLVVPLAWLAMALPAREVAARLVAPGWARVALGAFALSAWDIMLDPQMVDEGYWVWQAGGPWRGIPLSNYAGWLVSSAAVMGVLELLLPRPGASRPLLALYTWWGLTEAVAFVVFFGDPVVGLVGGAAMLSLAGLAWRAELGRSRGTATDG